MGTLTLFTVIIIAVIILALAVIGLFVTLAAAYRKTFAVPKFKEKDLFILPPGEQFEEHKNESIALTKEALAHPYEKVWISSRDGVKLYGRYYHSNDGAPLQIMFHGYRGAAERDFGGGLKEALAAGYNVLLVDQRAHWKSGGRCLTFGVKERYDCADWIDYAVNRFGGDVKIVLSGISMGAATVLMASGLELPDNVKGIMADCGYTSPKDIIKLVIGYMKLPVGVTYPVVRLAGRLFGGFDIESASAEQAMARCRVPVLFIHGEDDRFVPCRMSEKNYELCASPVKRLVTVPGAGHGLSYMTDRQRYMDAVGGFLKEIGAEV